jgi:predicted GIY-YIG superfamily endonuclease
MIPLGNEYKRMIYRIIFPNNVCYVGLTNDINRRKNEHFNKGVVFNYINTSNLIPIVETLTDYIHVDDAIILEEYWKLKSEDAGYVCLNSAKTGGLGCSDVKWTKDKCKLEASKYFSRIEFQNISPSAYNSARKNKWIDEICSHMTILRNSWTKDECKMIAIKYKNRGSFSKNNHKVWDFARKYNWLDEICSHMIILRNKWTKDECIVEASKFKNRNEFKNNNNPMWQFAKKHNWLDEICSHMILLRHIWTKEECIIESLKYKNITEFSTNNHNAYEFARKRKWLNEIKNKIKNKK